MLLNIVNGIGVGVGVGLAVAVAVAVGIGLGVEVRVGVAVGMDDAVFVGDGVTVAVGTGVGLSSEGEMTATIGSGAGFGSARPPHAIKVRPETTSKALDNNRNFITSTPLRITIEFCRSLLYCRHRLVLTWYAAPLRAFSRRTKAVPSSKGLIHASTLVQLGLGNKLTR